MMHMPFLMLLLLLVLIFWTPSHFADAQNASIQNASITYVNFSAPASCNNNEDLGILCDKDAHDYDGHVLLANSTNSTGYVLLRNQVQMLDSVTLKATSFSAAFTFQNTRSNASGSGQGIGDGMAFMMFDNKTYRGSPQSTLGVFQWDYYSVKIFAVEYDIYWNEGIDPNDNHIGVDLKDANSLKTADANSVGIDLKGGYPIRTWIDYDSSRSKVEVRIAKSPTVMPINPLLKYQVDLSTIVGEFMSVGISASSGGGWGYHELYDLSFATFAPTPRGDSKLAAGVIAGISLAAVGLLCLGTWVILRKCRRSSVKMSETEPYIEGDFQRFVDMPTRFTYKQLSDATNGFSESSKLGHGGTSTVYRGVIAGTGAQVAVKKVTNDSKTGEKQFLEEIRVVSRLRHRNLVKLLGWCSDRDNYLIVYELMPNGSLDRPLFKEGRGPGVLPWNRRLTIVQGVAAGLAYLHDEYAERVIHRDIKSSNVLLDENFNAKLGDFGLARFTEHSKDLRTTVLGGTIGYFAPEVLLTWKSTAKTDIYAFGILVLEVVCGRRPIDEQAPLEEMILLDWVWNLHAQNNILGAVDPRLDGGFSEVEVMNMLLTALLCGHTDPAQRPSMRQVQQYLSGDVHLPPVPKIKPMAPSNDIQRQGSTMTDGRYPNSSKYSSLSISSSSASEVPSLGSDTTLMSGREDNVYSKQNVSGECSVKGTSR